MRMLVHFKAPETAPHCQTEYVFPNTQDVPFSYSGDTLVARYAVDAEHYRLLQKDLMDMAVGCASYLSGMPMAVDGKAIVYYRSQPLTAKGECKRLELPEALFSFGVVMRSVYGECGMYLQPERDKMLCVHSFGEGIAEDLVRKIVMPYVWKARVAIEFQSQSRFREIVVRSSPNHRWYGYFGRGFNIPPEERMP